MIERFLKNLHLKPANIYIKDWYDGLVCGIYKCDVTNSEFAAQLIYWDTEKEIKIYELAQIDTLNKEYDIFFKGNRFDINELKKAIISDIYIIYTKSDIESYLIYEKFSYFEFKVFENIDEIIDQSIFLRSLHTIIKGSVSE